MPLDHQAVKAAIENAIAENDEEDTYSPRQIADIAFHMTDWLRDFEDFAAFCASPSSYSAEEVSKLLKAFLYHVPNHVAAAAKLYVDFPVRDVFGVGAVDVNEGPPKSPAR